MLAHRQALRWMWMAYCQHVLGRVHGKGKKGKGVERAEGSTSKKKKQR